MFMLPKDLKEAALLERRRRLEQERKIQLLDQRKRCIGIDSEGLAKQVAERKAREQEEFAINEAHEIQRVRDAQCAILLQKKIDEEQRRKNEAINAFRFKHQGKETRREFDLYDRDGWKTALPGRLSDDDARCGISSAQKFEGEDLSSGLRQYTQREQMRSWLEQQIEEHREADAQRKAADAEYDATVLDQDRRACLLDLQEQEVKRQQLEAAQRFNKALADDVEHKRRVTMDQNEEINKAEIYNLLTSDLLTENPVQISSMGPGHIISSMYKGMSDAERTSIRNFQLKQIEENKLQRAREARRDAEFEEAANGLALAGTLRERELERRQKEFNEKILQQNQRLAFDQKSHQMYLEKVVFTNQPTARFYDQFNRSAR